MKKEAAKSKAPQIPTVKSQLPSDQWLKRVESRVYRRHVARLVRFLKGVNTPAGKLSREKREIAHFFLDAATFEESRRQRSPAERIADIEKTEIATEVKAKGSQHY